MKVVRAKPSAFKSHILNIIRETVILKDAVLILSATILPQNVLMYYIF